MLLLGVSPGCVQLALLLATSYWPPTMAFSCSTRQSVSHTTTIWKTLVWESSESSASDFWWAENYWKGDIGCAGLMFEVNSWTCRISDGSCVLRLVTGLTSPGTSRVPTSLQRCTNGIRNNDGSSLRDQYGADLCIRSWEDDQLVVQKGSISRSIDRKRFPTSLLDLGKFCCKRLQTILQCWSYLSRSLERSSEP